MTNLAQPQPVAVEPQSLEQQYAYVMGLLNLQDPGFADKTLSESAKSLAEQFHEGLETIEKASGFRLAPPLERLIAYRMKGQDLWDEYVLKLPHRFERTWKDWQDLREKAAAGFWGPAVQAEEIAWSAAAEAGVQ